MEKISACFKNVCFIEFVKIETDKNDCIWLAAWYKLIMQLFNIVTKKYIVSADSKIYAKQFAKILEMKIPQIDFVYQFFTKLA